VTYGVSVGWTVEHLYDVRVFERLRDAIGDIDTDLVELGDVPALCALQDLLAERVNAAVARLDTEGAHGIDGAVSMPAWLRHKACQSAASASRVVRTGRKLRYFDAVRDAWHTGSLSAAHVEVIVANVKERHMPLFAEHQHDMVKQLAHMTVEDAQKVMRWWSLLADDLIPGPGNDDPPDSLHLSRSLGDRGVLKGSFSPEVTAIIDAALQLITVDDPDVPAEQRRAEALALICQFVLDHHDKPKTRRNRPHVAVIMREGPDGNPVGETLQGVPVSRSRLQQWLCDGLVGRVMTAGSQILDYGLSTPTVPIGLWQAVALRDRGCRWEVCGRPIGWCEAHHVNPFPGGPTSLDNLALFCSTHHHKLHDGSGWTAVLHPDGQLDITSPTGVTTSTFPPGHRRTLWPPGDDEDEDGSGPDPPTE
jgi:hypothetical protein